MRRDTLRLLREVATIESIGDFLFVGGSALAFQVNHRISGGLDFGYLGLKLPEERIKDIVNKWSRSHPVTLQVDNTTIQEAENEGISLLEHQQSWLVDNVKITFFAFGSDAKETQAIATFTTRKYGNVKILGLDGLFFTKCLKLSKTLDLESLFDIWWFTEHGKSISDVFNTIQSIYPHLTYEAIRYRLLDWPITIKDKVQEQVKAELNVTEVRNKLREQVNVLEVDMAREHVNKMSLDL